MKNTATNAPNVMVTITRTIPTVRRDVECILASAEAMAVGGTFLIISRGIDRIFYALIDG
jgi:hypothetical protein